MSLDLSKVAQLVIDGDFMFNCKACAFSSVFSHAQCHHCVFFLQIPRMVKVVEESSPYFKVISPKDIGHKVAPGVPSIFRVVFTPEENKVVAGLPRKLAECLSLAVCNSAHSRRWWCRRWHCWCWFWQCYRQRYWFCGASCVVDGFSAGGGGIGIVDGVVGVVDGVIVVGAGGGGGGEKNEQDR